MTPQERDFQLRLTLMQANAKRFYTTELRLHQSLCLTNFHGPLVRTGCELKFELHQKIELGYHLLE